MAQMRQTIKQQQRGLDHLLEQLAHAEKELHKLRGELSHQKGRRSPAGQRRK